MEISSRNIRSYCFAHTPSFTHNFVTHTHTIFVTHHLSHTTLSHTTLFYFSILHHLLCLSFLPRPPLQHLAPIIGRSCLVGKTRMWLCLFTKELHGLWFEPFEPEASATWCHLRLHVRGGFHRQPGPWTRTACQGSTIGKMALAQFRARPGYTVNDG